MLRYNFLLFLIILGSNKSLTHSIVVNYLWGEEEEHGGNQYIPNPTNEFVCRPCVASIEVKMHAYRYILVYSLLEWKKNITTLLTNSEWVACGGLFADGDAISGHTGVRLCEQSSLVAASSSSVADYGCSCRLLVSLHSPETLSLNTGGRETVGKDKAQGGEDAGVAQWEKMWRRRTVSYTHLTLPTTPYV